MILIFLALLLGIGCFAAMKFSELARKKGYDGGKAKRYPLLLMVVAIAATLILFLLATVLGASVPGMQSLALAMFVGGGCFVLAVDVLILFKAYRNMQNAPDAGR